MRLFYSREKAGWNNVRITLESLLVVARLTNRQLVMPPPSHIEHLDALFHELQVYDAAELALVADFSTGPQEPQGEAVRGNLSDIMRLHRRGQLATQVYVDPQDTRLHHFEALGLEPAEARLAAHTVLGLRIAAPYVQAAAAATEGSGLAHYHGVHLRRGDFATFRPHTQWSGAAVASKVAETFPREEKDLPLVVACVVNPDEQDPFPELAWAFPNRRVLRSDDVQAANAGGLHRIVLDTLILSSAFRFLGTPDSTFSTGVWHWRAAARVLRGERVETPTWLGPPSESAWAACSHFKALELE